LTGPELVRENRQRLDAPPLDVADARGPSLPRELRQEIQEAFIGNL
jgi:hypothetical protein